MRWKKPQLPDRRTAIIDFAHNNHGLTRALRDARCELSAGGKLKLMLSSKGHWGREKRISLGEAARDADLVYVTDDDPRAEDPATIRAQLASVIPDAKVMAGRPRCLAHLLSRMKEKDILLVAGRGADDQFQTATGRRSYSDVDLLREWQRMSVAA